MIKAILACEKNGGIGNKGKLPWPFLKKDMEHFVSITKNQIIVMGFNTFKSLNYHPLIDRFNIVLIKRGELSQNDFLLGHKNLLFLNDDEFIKIIKLKKSLFSPIKKDIIIIGGAKVIESYFDMIDIIYLTKIEKEFDSDTFIDLKKIKENFTTLNIGPLFNQRDICFFFEYLVSNRI